jgi:quercetin 2,3-dioxygenase
MDSAHRPVLQQVPLGASPWPTIDPFLFCVHHVDAYPHGDGNFGPATGLDSRALGADFSGLNGWSMYHGDTVPGFPQHPHRGFETVTVVRSGLIDHSDSIRMMARYGAGDTQWLTAGAGIVHSEMFPLLHEDEPNPLELFQIWVNLPARNKMVDPHFVMMWAKDQPHVVEHDNKGRAITLDIVAGRYGDVRPIDPPPASWAAHPESDVAIWQIHLDPEACWTLPAAAGAETVRVLYVFAGDALDVGGYVTSGNCALVIDATSEVFVQAGATGASMLLLQGRPIGEPVVQHGPFVMNTQAEIQQAFIDYRSTGFGGWPWPTDGPVHGRDPKRRTGRSPAC